MKKFNLYNLILTFLLFVILFSNARAQSSAPEGDNPPSRPNLLRELDLSPIQIQQMRQINQQRRPSLESARMRLQQANAALDKAIYADVENEEEIQSRLREVQEAQNEMIKNRMLTERAIRRILNSQQLARFRELRSEFMKVEIAPTPKTNRRNRLKSLPRGLRRPGSQNRPNQIQ